MRPRYIRTRANTLRVECFLFLCQVVQIQMRHNEFASHFFLFFFFPCSILQKSLDSKVSQIGNFVHESVPIGDDEDKYNRVESTWGKCRESTKDLMHHHQLMEMIDGYESQRGVNVAGHRAYFLKGVGVLLNQALINFGLSFLMKKQCKKRQNQKQTKESER